MSQVRCPNTECNWTGEVQDCSPIDDIWERVEPGEIFPAGQCPNCGILVPPNPEDITGHVPEVAAIHELIQYMFFDEEAQCYDSEKELGGADTIQFLDELLRRHNLLPEAMK